MKNFQSLLQVSVLSTLLTFLVILIAQPNNVNAEQTKPVIGVAAPLSGPVAAMGQALRKGFDLYQKENPGLPYKIVFEDHKYEGKDTLSALHKLRDIDNAELVVVWGNMPAGAAAPVAESRKIPVLALSMNPDAKDREFVVTLGPPIGPSIEIIYKQIMAWDIKKPAAVSIDIGAALEGVELIKKRLGGELLVHVVSNTESDFKTVISKLKKQNVDGLVLFALPEQALTFLKQAKQLDFRPHILGGDVFADSSFQTSAAQLSDKITFVYGAVTQDFLKRLVEAYGDGSYFFESASGYAMAAMIDRATRLRQSEIGSSKPAENYLIEAMGRIELNDLPLVNLVFKNTPEQGRHFVADAMIYKVPIELTNTAATK